MPIDLRELAKGMAAAGQQIGDILLRKYLTDEQMKRLLTELETQRQLQEEKIAAQKEITQQELEAEREQRAAEREFQIGTLDPTKRYLYERPNAPEAQQYKRLVSKIQAANSLDELEKLKPEIDKLPEDLAIGAADVFADRADRLTATEITKLRLSETTSRLPNIANPYEYSLSIHDAKWKVLNNRISDTLRDIDRVREKMAQVQTQRIAGSKRDEALKTLQAQEEALSQRLKELSQEKEAIENKILDLTQKAALFKLQTEQFRANEPNITSILKEAKRDINRTALEESLRNYEPETDPEYQRLYKVAEDYLSKTDPTWDALSPAQKDIKIWGYIKEYKRAKSKK